MKSARVSVDFNRSELLHIAKKKETTDPLPTAPNVTLFDETSEQKRPIMTWGELS